MEKKTGLINKVKSGALKAGHFVGNTVKVGIAVVAAAATTEAAFVGTNMLQSDAHLVKSGVQHAVSPEPVLAKKKGIFAKKEVVTINPVTGKVSPYTGGKKPVNKKPVILK